MARAAVLTASDRVSGGLYEDESGHIAVKILKERLGFNDVKLEVLPDDRMMIEEKLRAWSDSDRYDLVITSGGTGISPRDVTPDATIAVVSYIIPGLGEVMRAASLSKTPMAALSRAVAGVRGRTLIINLPGSPNGVRECLEAILPVIPHALEQLASGAGH